MLHRSSGVETLPGGLGGRLRILSRKLCLFRRVDCRALPAADRSSALALEILQWSPFEDTGSWVSWQQGDALVWIWDAARPEAQGSGGKIVPETLLTPPPDPAENRLIHCLEGVEGQVWDEQGNLVASHWWPQAPDLLQWQRFLRSAGANAASQCPDAQKLEWLPRPWARNQAGTGRRAPALGVVLGGVMAVFLLALALEAVDYWRWAQAHDRLAERAANLESRVEPVLSARNQAEDDRAAVQQLVELFAAPSQLQMMQTAYDKLSRSAPGVRLLEWRYRSGELRLSITAPNLDPRRLAEALLDQTHFTDVAVEPDRRQEVLTLRVNTSSGVQQ